MWWVEEIEKRTNGRVRFSVFTGGSLAKTKETLDTVKTGIAELGLLNVPHYPDKLPLINMQPPAFFAPADQQVLLKVYADMFKNPAVVNDAERYGLKIICPAPSTTKDLGSTTPIKTFADLKGKKVGTVGVWYPKALSAAGAVPVTTGAPAMYQSLQTGLIDTVIIGVGSIKAFKLNEVAKEITWVGTGAEIVGMTVMNRDAWEELPPDIQKVFLDTAQDALQWNAEEMDRYTERGAQAIKESGGTFYEFSFEEKVKWANAMSNLPKEWADEMDAKGMPGTEVMQLFIDTCEKYGHEWPRKWELK